MKRTVSFWAVDGAIGVGLFVLSITSLRDYEQLGVNEVFLRQMDPLGILLIALQTLPLVFRRRFPIAILAIVTAAWMLDRWLDYPGTMATIAPLFAIAAVGSELPPRRSALIGGSVIGLVSVYTLFGATYLESVGYDDVVIILLTGVVALYIGREIQTRRRLHALVEERAERAEQDREQAAQRAVADERSRIARELHDVVAHEIVVMTLQAEGASRLADDKTDPRIRDALGAISAAGREGMAEMRRMVGLLRESDDGEPLEPQPGLSHLSQLADHFAENGLAVDVHVTGEPRLVPSSVELSAYRIVQESLTNALKHGGPDVHADVTVAYEDDAVAITVLDDGRGAAATPTMSGGHGLVGMRERVGLLSGSLKTGPHAGGGFEVQARLPVHP